MVKVKMTPALGFNGQCNEAIALYERAFGAKIREKVLYSQANPKDFQYKPEEKDFVFYAEMSIGNKRISLGDDSMNLLGEIEPTNSHKMSLLMEFESDEALKTAYEILSAGATIITPLCNTTYCTAYVVLVDKFGIRWDLMSGYEG
ncbi:MAG: VOC family protein [Bacteroidales bacterium]|nr:VOC family protein [Bacteroidales bacterium]